MEQHTGNLSELAERIVTVRPTLAGKEAAFATFCRKFVQQINAAGLSGRQQVIEQTREDYLNNEVDALSKEDLALKFACSVVVDMVAQGWDIAPVTGGLELRPPQVKGVSREEQKERIRTGHLLERDAQLREPSVRKFIGSMELKRIGPKGDWVSIFSLLRDGRVLADQLTRIAEERDELKRLEKLAEATSPYLQVVEPGATCEHTGLKLTDIWRYFRHTWVNTYKSLPGRGMMILIRDAAAPKHPVIGIAALGSSMAQQTLRDQWIGWDSEHFVERVAAEPSAKTATWVLASVQRLLDGIYQADLINDGIVERGEIRRPTWLAIDRLNREALRCIEEHRSSFTNLEDHKGTTQKKVDWKKQAKTYLFRSKRAKTMALVLGIRQKLALAGLDSPTRAALRQAMSTSSGRDAVGQLVRLVKAEHVGVDMMDIIVCGAVPPYSDLLGGKLICTLLTSPEVVQFYREKYGEQESVIASSMKGQAVRREPNLVLLCTTSLYGVGSSQYNRIKIPLDAIGSTDGGQIQYEDLGISKGYGSYHFSKASLKYLDVLLGRVGVGRKVNSIFGEGVNPLMRKLREGLTIVGFPTNPLLQHGNARVVYGVPLAKNFRDILLGFQSRPKYLLPLKKAAEQTGRLADYWRRRWLLGRISKADVLERVASHTLSYPIEHGARVVLPKGEEQDLFD